MLLAYMFVYQDWVLDLTCSQFLELSYGIAWNANWLNLETFHKQISPSFSCGAWCRGWLCWSLDISIKNYSLSSIKLLLLGLFYVSYKFLFNPCKYELSVTACVYQFTSFISYILRFSHQILRGEKAFRILLRPIREAKRVSHTWKNRFVQSQTTV